MTDNNIIELTPFRADLTRALALRGERLLAATDLADEVATLEPLEAYYIVREIGLDQALPILLQLSHEQLQAGIDLDCWNRYDFAADNLTEWLTAFAQAGPATLARAFLSLDYVVQLLFLAQTVTVYDPDTDQVPPEDKEHVTSRRAMTPDGFYLLELKTEIALKIHPFTLLDAMYQYDPTATHRLLSEVRVDLPTQIEEEALRFRNGRMQDIGFVTPDEAAALFSRPATRQPLPRPKPLESGRTRVPSVYAGPLIETTLLQQALSLITDQEFLSRLEQEIVWAINSATIAYGEKTQDIKQITDIAERVRDTISLGLESLLAQQEPDCPPDGAAAAVLASDLLNVWSITDLFRHGFAATLGLQQEVRQALREPRFHAWYNLPETEQSDEPGDRLERAFVTALLGRHPMRSGFDLANAEEVKAFACLVDINVAHVRLQRLVARICGQL
jgi:hypothetical protein